MKSENANNTTVTVDHKNIPKDWKKMKLKEVADLSKIPWKVGDENLPYIGLEHIEENKLRLSGVGNSNDIKSSKFLFTKNEFLFGKLRPYFRKLYKPKFKGICSTDIWVINSKTNTNKEFLFYLFANQDFVDLAYRGASGTRMPRADWDFMSETEWLIPKSKNEQKAIASILSSLDEKIDLLHRQNKTLETMAETMFRQWFIEEAKEDWEEKLLSFYGNIVCGKTPSKKKKEYFNGDIPFIKIPDMHGNTFVFQTSDSLSEEGRNSQSNKILPAKSICISCIATVGLVSMTVKESQTNQQINSIVPYKDYYRYYLYLFMKNFTDLLTAMASGGTATLNLNTGNFSKIKIPLPDGNILKECHKVIEPLFYKIFYNQKQIRTLEQLRDTLLPKLMSGEVRVKV